jgi:uncharacterized lipoprotein
MRMIPHATARAIPLALLAAALVATSGCGWFRGKSVYDQAPEARPLEVPPDLDAPRIDPSMNIPEVTAAPRASQATARAAEPSAAPFVIADTPESVYRRVGLALERIDGVEIAERAQLLAAYNVRFRGESFLVRVSAEADGSRISANTQDGSAASGAAADALLGLLRQRLN